MKTTIFRNWISAGSVVAALASWAVVPSAVAAVAAAASVPQTYALPYCSWNHPGVNPFMGDVVAAVDRYQDMPVDVREKLKARMTKRQYDDMVAIKRDSIIGRGGYDYGNGISEMHFGTNQVCRTVSRTAWTPQMEERGLVYCEGEHCILVPTVCRNVSRISRRGVGNQVADGLPPFMPPGAGYPGDDVAPVAAAPAVLGPYAAPGAGPTVSPLGGPIGNGSFADVAAPVLAGAPAGALYGLAPSSSPSVVAGGRSGTSTMVASVTTPTVDVPSMAVPAAPTRGEIAALPATAASGAAATASAPAATPVTTPVVEPVVAALTPVTPVTPAAPAASAPSTTADVPTTPIDTAAPPAAPGVGSSEPIAVAVTPIPEPSTWALLGAGLVAITALQRRRAARR